MLFALSFYPISDIALPTSKQQKFHDAAQLPQKSTHVNVVKNR
jgi:hypothetical protein